MPPLKVSPKDSPKLDLESYIANYDGPLRLERLIAVANSQSILSTEALRLAIIEAKKTINFNKYLSLVDKLAKIAPNDPLSVIDKDHVAVRGRKARAETDRLELELKQYKNNLIKESIRVGFQAIEAL
jgi:COP9 signalosome complex subunit 1